MNTRYQQLPALLQAFFLEWLIGQRNVSPCTVASYRDAFRLLLGFVAQRKQRAVSSLQLVDLAASTILAFLDYLENERGNSIRSRNARLAAIHAFFKYAALKVPEELDTITAVLAIPVKRFDQPRLGFLSRPEIEALIAAPDVATWSGQRDQLMWLMLYNTGARVSELLAIRIRDITIGTQATVQLHGKGRKTRTLPLWKRTVTCLKQWLQRTPLSAEQVLIPNRFGQPLTRSGVDHRLRLAIEHAKRSCPTLNERIVTPHTVRHTTAMHLLQSGVDITVIALWLGHESTATTHHYIEADLAMKEKALNTLEPPTLQPARYQPGDPLIAFLESL